LSKQKEVKTEEAWFGSGSEKQKNLGVFLFETNQIEFMGISKQ
jgi:hypothetical protein